MLAGTVPPAAAQARTLPAEVTEALQRARVPEDALAVAFQAPGGATTYVAQSSQRLVDPPSLAKLMTTSADRVSYSARAIEGVWHELGGRLTGRVRDGTAPAGANPAFEMAPPALSEVVRDTNKYSNSAMAQQLFLTLGLAQRGSGNPKRRANRSRSGWSGASKRQRTRPRSTIALVSRARRS